MPPWPFVKSGPRRPHTKHRVPTTSGCWGPRVRVGWVHARLCLLPAVSLGPPLSFRASVSHPKHGDDITCRIICGCCDKVPRAWRCKPQEPVVLRFCRLGVRGQSASKLCSPGRRSGRVRSRLSPNFWRFLGLWQHISPLPLEFSTRVCL